MATSARTLPLSLAPGDTSSNLRVIDLTVGQLLGILAAAMETTRDAKPKPEHYTVVEAMQILHCSERQVRRLIAQGRLRVAKVTNGRGSSRVLIPRAELEKLLSAA